MTHVQTVAVDHGRPSVPDHERPPKAVTASRSLCPSGSRIEETSDARAQCLDAVGNRPGFGHDRSPCGVSFGLRVVPRSNSENPSCASRVSRMYAKQYDLKLVKAPFDIPPIELQMQWHKYRDQDPALAWFRELLQSVAREI